MFIPIEKISNLQEFKKDIFSGKVFVFQKSKTSNDLITQIKNKIQNTLPKILFLNAKIKKDKLIVIIIFCAVIMLISR